jgi:hypothetical protein
MTICYSRDLFWHQLILFSFLSLTKSHRKFQTVIILSHNDTRCVSKIILRRTTYSALLPHEIRSFLFHTNKMRLHHRMQHFSQSHLHSGIYRGMCTCHKRTSTTLKVLETFIAIWTWPWISALQQWSDPGLSWPRSGTTGVSLPGSSRTDLLSS